MSMNAAVSRTRVLIALIALLLQVSFGWAEDSAFFPNQCGGESKLGGTCSSRTDVSEPAGTCGHRPRPTTEELVSDPDQGMSENESTSSGGSGTVAKSNGTVIMYCPTTWKCPTCEATKVLFRATGVKFEVHDYTKHMDVVKRYGNNAVPTFYYNGKYYAYNTNFTQLKRLLGIDGAASSGSADSASSCSKDSTDSTCSSGGGESEIGATTQIYTEAEIDSLISQLASENLETVRTAIANLVKGGAQCVDALVAALQDNANPAVKKSAAYILGKIGGEKAVQPLIKAFGDSNSAVVREAEIALGRIGESAVRPLVAAMKEAGEKGLDSTLIAATAAMVEVGVNGVDTAVEVLSELAASGSKTVVAAAKYAIEKINKLKKDETTTTTASSDTASADSSASSKRNITGNQYWVDSTYTGGTSNGKQATPWKTIGSLMSYIKKTGLKPGDYVHIKGSFKEGIDISRGANGTADKPIILSGSYGNSKAKLKHIHLTGAKYVIFEDFDVAPYSELPFHKYYYENSKNYNWPSGLAKYLNCVFLETNVSHVTFNRLYMHDGWQGVVLNPGASHVTFNNSDIFRTFLDGVQISDNTSTNNDYFKYIGGSIKGTGYSIWKRSGRHGVYLSGGHNHEFNGITFDDNYGGWGLSLRRGGVVVRNCIFKQSKSTGAPNTKVGVAYCNEDPSNAGYKVYIYNNLIVDKTSYYGLYFGGANDKAPKDPRNTFYIFNNTFINCTINIDDSLKINAYFWNNIVSAGGNNKIVSGGTHGYISNGWINGARIPSGGSSKTDVKVDPKFDANYFTSVSAYTNGGTATFGGHTVSWAKNGVAPGIGRSKTKR
ncbi:MAG: putative phycocyanin operon protein Z [bacterium ADurb.Bin374]|nr:MAG: putative phycocyanin operon protein Z [bacterium ADurb.Bin374]